MYASSTPVPLSANVAGLLLSFDVTVRKPPRGMLPPQLSDSEKMLGGEACTGCRVTAVLPRLRSVIVAVPLVMAVLTFTGWLEKLTLVGVAQVKPAVAGPIFASTPTLDVPGRVTGKSVPLTFSITEIFPELSTASAGTELP